jgi:hypothetical protein
VSSGIRQYVMIGAGFDSFALRRPSFARLELIEDLTAPQLLQRYDGEGINGLQTTLISRIARAQN